MICTCIQWMRLASVTYSVFSNVQFYGLVQACASISANQVHSPSNARYRVTNVYINCNKCIFIIGLITVYLYGCCYLYQFIRFLNRSLYAIIYGYYDYPIYSIYAFSLMYIFNPSYTYQYGFSIYGLSPFLPSPYFIAFYDYCNYFTQLLNKYYYLGVNCGQILFYICFSIYYNLYIDKSLQKYCQSISCWYFLTISAAFCFYFLSVIFMPLRLAVTCFSQNSSEQNKLCD